jgi:hypothetical protein
LLVLILLLLGLPQAFVEVLTLCMCLLLHADAHFCLGALIQHENEPSPFATGMKLTDLMRCVRPQIGDGL